MIRHLTPTDYRSMAWANGKGVTVEMLRVEGDGALLWRLSRASVVEDGAFSIFPEVERNLTVITGPGFDLLGEGLHLPARPLQPVAFAGDIAIRAANVRAPSDDFNVMTARHLPRPEVQVLSGRHELSAGGTLALLALDAAAAGGKDFGRYDLFLTDQAVATEGPIIAVRLFGAALD